MKKKLITIFGIIVIILSGIAIYYFSNYDNTLVDPETISTDSKYENVVYNKEEDILDKDVLGILTIDKISLKATVKEGTSNSILKEYIGHIENTSLYDGNIGLART